MQIRRNPDSSVQRQQEMPYTGRTHYAPTPHILERQRPADRIPVCIVTI